MQPPPQNIQLLSKHRVLSLKPQLRLEWRGQTSDWVMDIGAGAGDKGGRVVTFGTPDDIAASPISRTAPYPLRFRAGRVTAPHRRPRPWQSSPQ
jgi:hypothetical protein